jgi:hypothetical protein
VGVLLWGGGGGGGGAPPPPPPWPPSTVFSQTPMISFLDSQLRCVIIDLAPKLARRLRSENGVRKVRAPQGTVLGNAQAG